MVAQAFTISVKTPDTSTPCDIDLRTGGGMRERLEDAEDRDINSNNRLPEERLTCAVHVYRRIHVIGITIQLFYNLHFVCRPNYLQNPVYNKILFQNESISMQALVQPGFPGLRTATELHISRKIKRKQISVTLEITLHYFVHLV